MSFTAARDGVDPPCVASTQGRTHGADFHIREPQHAYPAVAYPPIALNSV